MTLRRTVLAAFAAAALTSFGLAGPALASATHQSHHHASHFRVRIVLNGAKLRHTFRPNGTGAPQIEALADPDDITVLGHHIFVGFQNGVGPQGQASTDGNLDSTIVEFTPSGHVVHKWDLRGKCDGVTADTQAHLLIATVDEDANSSIYTITPGALPGEQVTHYAYNKSPLPQNGGSDAISIYHGLVLISASAPGTVTGSAPAPQATYPAAYILRFHKGKHDIAFVTPLFYDEADATVANVGADFGQTVQLALTDPDSNEDVPSYAPRFRGDFMLTSQGDEEQIFVQPGHGKFGSDLHVLKLTHSVDDTAWARSSGTLYGDNTSHDWVEAVTGPFRRGEIFAAITPCDENSAPAICPAPGYPPNSLGTLNPWTGVLTQVALRGPSFNPQGMVFIGPHWEVWPG
jgi:hypothetical protein